MAEKQATFAELVQMIADKELPEGTVVETPMIAGSTSPDRLKAVYSGAFGLRWDEGGGSILITPAVASDPWFIPEVYKEITFIEAVKAVVDGETVYADDEKEPLEETSDLSAFINITGCHDIYDLAVDTTWYKKGFASD